MPPKSPRSAKRPSDPLPWPANYRRSVLLANAMDGPRGQQSALEGVMMADRLGIFAGLTNTDLHNLRLTSKTMYDRLADQDLVQGELRDRCDEVLPQGTGIPSHACRNSDFTRVKIYYCQGEQYGFLTSQLGRHGPDHGTGNQYHTVCNICRDLWPTPVGRLQSFRDWMRSNHTKYRATVCGLCAAQQEGLHPNGHDGCHCEREYARPRLCRVCSNNAYHVMDGAADLTDFRTRHAMVRNGVVRYNGPWRRKPACMCGKRDARLPSGKNGIPPETRQCKVCTEYISVPNMSFGAHPFGKKNARKRKGADEDDSEKDPKRTKLTNAGKQTSTKTQGKGGQNLIVEGLQSRRPHAGGPLVMLSDKRGQGPALQGKNGFLKSLKGT